MSEGLLLLIGIFIIVAVLVIFGIILSFRRKKKKLIKEIPSEDFKILNYDFNVLKKLKAQEKIANIGKEVITDGKQINRERKEELSTTDTKTNVGPDDSIPEEDRGIGESNSDEGRGRDVKERNDIPKRSIDRSKPNSERIGGRRKPSWR